MITWRSKSYWILVEEKTLRNNLEGMALIKACTAPDDKKRNSPLIPIRILVFFLMFSLKLVIYF